MRHAWLAAILILGCGVQPVMLHPVKGQITKAGKAVSGGTVQFAHQTEPNVRAVGVIGADGRYTLKTLADNSSRTGAQSGAYKAVIAFGHEPAVHHGTVYMVFAGDNTIDIELP